MRIFDARMRLRTPEMLKAWTDPAHFNPVYEQYIDKYHMEPRLSVMPTHELMDAANMAGIDRVMVCTSNNGEAEDVCVHAYDIGKNHQRDKAIARPMRTALGISLKNGIEHAVNAIDNAAVYSAGIEAINFAPSLSGIDVDDRRCYPIYAACVMFNIPLIMHGSMHFYTGASAFGGSPEKFDRICIDFPKLKLIMSHGGSGFGSQALYLAYRHPNLYLEFAALLPKYLPVDYIKAACSYLRRKCLFASGYPLLDFDVAVKAWKEALGEDAEDFFYNNAMRVFGIHDIDEDEL